VCFTMGMQLLVRSRVLRPLAGSQGELFCGATGVTA
jgi:hypothetical protein